jgi:nucleoid-associated protein YgaU
MGDMVDAVDRRVGAIHGRVGAARVGVGAGGRPLLATADPVVGLNAYGDTTMPRAGSVRGRSAAASAASGAKCGPVDRASAQSGTAYAHASATRGRRTGDARLQQGSRSAAADHAGRSAVAPAAVVVTRKGAHLTRRGQLVLIALVAVVALAVAGLLMSRTGGTATERPEPVGQRSIVVQPGQTLWSIAKDVAPDRDIREVIYEIRRINGLDNAMVRSGQTLVLPSG